MSESAAADATGRAQSVMVRGLKHNFTYINLPAELKLTNFSSKCIESHSDYLICINQKIFFV